MNLTCIVTLFEIAFHCYNKFFIQSFLLFVSYIHDNENVFSPSSPSLFSLLFHETIWSWGKLPNVV